MMYALNTAYFLWGEDVSKTVRKRPDPVELIKWTNRTKNCKPLKLEQVYYRGRLT